MTQELLEKHSDLVFEMSTIFLDNMEIELGRKYKDNTYEVNSGLTDVQFTELKAKYELNDNEFARLYLDFQKMKPTEHLEGAMDAFTKSGGNVDIEPSYDEDTQRLKVSVTFEIKGNTLDKIEGLSDMEDNMLRLNAMLQVETILSGRDASVTPEF